MLNQLAKAQAAKDRKKKKRGIRGFGTPLAKHNETDANLSADGIADDDNILASLQECYARKIAPLRQARRLLASAKKRERRKCKLNKGKSDVKHVRFRRKDLARQLMTVRELETAVEDVHMEMLGVQARCLENQALCSTPHMYASSSKKQKEGHSSVQHIARLSIPDRIKAYRAQMLELKGRKYEESVLIHTKRTAVWSYVAKLLENELTLLNSFQDPMPRGRRSEFCEDTEADCS